MTSDSRHWNDVYTRRKATEVSWYQDHCQRSLALIHATGCGRDAAIIDVGGGASTLAGDLLAQGYPDITVLDISQQALRTARDSLGDKGGRIHWLAADITRADLPAHHYDIWHDRAVFHFLTDPQDRQCYVDAVRKAVKPGGHVIVATFASDGPEKCSGLPVVRYEAEGLHGEFGDDFQLTNSEKEMHHTPAGGEQSFIYCYCRKV